MDMFEYLVYGVDCWGSGKLLQSFWSRFDSDLLHMLNKKERKQVAEQARDYISKSEDREIRELLDRALQESLDKKSE